MTAALCWSPAAVALNFAAHAAWSLSYEVSSTAAAHSACLPALARARAGGEILADPANLMPRASWPAGPTACPAWPGSAGCGASCRPQPDSRCRRQQLAMAGLLPAWSRLGDRRDLVPAAGVCGSAGPLVAEGGSTGALAVTFGGCRPAGSARTGRLPWYDAGYALLRRVAGIRNAQQSILVRLPTRAGRAAREASAARPTAGHSCRRRRRGGPADAGAAGSPRQPTRAGETQRASCCSRRRGAALYGEGARLVRLGAALHDPRIDDLARQCARIAGIAREPGPGDGGGRTGRQA